MNPNNKIKYSKCLNLVLNAIFYSDFFGFEVSYILLINLKL